MSSKLSIGPLNFYHHVQSISIDEQKAVKILQTTRSSKDLVVDSGKSTQKAVITLLFTGITEINKDLRSLCALFRISPIISLENEMLSKAWRVESDGILYNQIPVALEQLSLSTVPDVVDAIYVNLVVSRIDVSMAGSSVIQYQSEKVFDKSIYGKDAFWLKKWLDKVLNSDFSKVLGSTNFGLTSFKFVEKNLITSEIIQKSNLDSPTIKIQSQSCTVQNQFSYYNLNGKGSPVCQYMGSSSRHFSADIIMLKDSIADGYDKFTEIKEAADRSIREKNKKDRIFGIVIDSPLSRLLNSSYYKDENTLSNTEEFYVPITIMSETTSEPYVKTVRIDLSESNHNFHTDNEIIINSGASDYDALKKHFDRIVKEEFTFRNSGKKIDATDDSNYESLTVFWPIEGFGKLFNKNDTFGILNIDSLKATFLHLDYDLNQDLLKSLNKSKFVTGQLVIGESQLNVFRRISINIEELNNIVNGPDTDTIKEFRDIYNNVKKYVSKMLESTERIEERDINEATLGITYSFIGDFTSLGSLSFQGAGVVQKLFGSKFKFTKLFTDTLFKVLVERKSSPVFARPAYSEDSIYSSFFKLLTSYAKYAKMYDPALVSNTSTDISKNKKRSLFPDMLLPRYIDLYGDSWKDFAPTYGSLGLVNYNVGKGFTGSAQDVIAVKEDDFVSPGAWFFNRKFKNKVGGILSLVDPLSDAASDSSPNLTLSIPFETDDIDEIEEILEQRAYKKNGNFGKDTITAIIKKTFDKYQTENPLRFREDMDRLRLLSMDKYYNTYLSSNSKNLSVYYTNNGSPVGKRYMNFPGLGAEIYRIANEMEELTPSQKLPHLECDSNYKSAGSKEYNFIRSLNENNKRCIKSSIDQVPDDHESFNRFFPACKVYLLEKRGTDLIGDDSMFTVNPIISIDITLDKEDADLAVIRIADPLYLLQKDFFPYGNIQTVKDERGNVVTKGVLSNLNGNSDQGYMKRYKLAQGRAIMIKMGYDANPESLKTVFTGRISEIDPGEILTIVAQGWKVELINKQVAFNNTNSKHWGAKDLAIQTIVNADPAGFGDFYPQRDTNFILRNITNADAQEIVNQTLRLQENHNTEHGEIENVSDKAINSMREFLGLTSLDKDNVGLDTRLKNIWYPEIPRMNNLFGLRSYSEVGINYINDGWVIPAKPAWDVLKEACRHTWGTITQVVPYDGEATIFFGQPDQPYFFTKGNSRLRDSYEAYKSNFIKNNNDNLPSLIDGFLKSDSYSQNSLTNLNPNNSLFNKDQYYLYLELLKRSNVNHLVDVSSMFNSPFRQIDNIVKAQGPVPSYTILSSSFGIRQDLPESYLPSRAGSSLERLYTDINFSPDKGQNYVVQNLISSSLPFSAFSNLKDKYLGHRTIPILCEILFDIDQLNLYSVWPSVNQDFEEMVRGDPDNTVKILADRLPDYKAVRNLSGLAEEVESIANRKNASIEVLESKLSELIAKYRNFDRDKDTIQESLKEIRSYIDILAKYRNGDPSDFIDDLRNARATLEKRAFSLRNSQSTNKSNKFGLDTSEILSVNNILRTKLFVYFFNQYIAASSTAETLSKELSSISVELPPTMQVFRVHHYIDDDHHIIQNNIVATTRDMWNTVVIEHPAKDSLSSKVSSKDSLYRKEELFSGIKWEYWPKQEVTGVIGLQFHPGLTLTNKKLRIFTEANVQTETLASKIALNRLAEGLKKMYRGSIIMVGKVIKPYDRIIINDNFTDMQGTVEVESVIHHWSVESGWVTDVIPEAIADVNPGASILQTAALEGIYRKVYSAIDVVSDIVTIAIIISSLGTATAPALALDAAGKEVATAAAKKAVSKGLTGSLKRLVEGKKNLIKDSLKNLKNNAVNLHKRFTQEGISLSKSPFHYLLKLVKETVGPPTMKYLSNQVIAGLSEQAVESLFKFHVVAGYIEEAQKAEQLPVIISPLMFNGIPLMAGLEVDDPIWSLYFNNTFWSMRDMQAGAASVLEELGLGNFESFTKGTYK